MYYVFSRRTLYINTNILIFYRQLDSKLLCNEFMIYVYKHQIIIIFCYSAVLVNYTYVRYNHVHILIYYQIWYDIIIMVYYIYSRLLHWLNVYLTIAPKTQQQQNTPVVKRYSWVVKLPFSATSPSPQTECSCWAVCPACRLRFCRC